MHSINAEINFKKFASFVYCNYRNNGYHAKIIASFFQIFFRREAIVVTVATTFNIIIIFLISLSCKLKYLLLIARNTCFDIKFLIIIFVTFLNRNSLKSFFSLIIVNINTHNSGMSQHNNHLTTTCDKYNNN